MSQRKTILIVGVSSFIGRNLAEFFSEEYRVVGTYFKNKVFIDNVTNYKLDVRELDEAHQLIKFIKPDIVIYCAGVSNLNYCYQNSIETEQVNTRGLFHVVNACEFLNSKIIYLSSAYVFSGSDYLYQVTDSPVPNTSFGNQKASAEFYLTKSYYNYLILRCPVIYGQGKGESYQNWFQTIQESYLNDKALEADNRLKIGHISVKYLAVAIKEAIQRNLHGETIHLSSTDVMTRYEFALAYAEVFKEDTRKINKVRTPFPELSKINYGIQLAGEYRFELDISGTFSTLGIEVDSIKSGLIDYKKTLEIKKSKVLKLI